VHIKLAICRSLIEAHESQPGVVVSAWRWPTASALDALARLREERARRDQLRAFEESRETTREVARP